MQLNKLNTILKYEFVLKHKNLKEYCENYFKYKDVLTNKYDLYTLMYIDNINNFSYMSDNGELYIYLGIDESGLNHVFICINLKVNLVYNEFCIKDKDIGNIKDKNKFVIHRVNVPNEIFKKYIKCLTDTYEIVGY